MSDHSRSRSRSRSPEPARNDDAPQSNGGGGGGGGDAEEGVKIHVGNLSYDTDESRLRSTFGEFGTITDVFLPVDRMNNNRPRGFGFVTFADKESADNAVAKLNDTELDGRTIRVNESRPPGARSGGGGGGGGGGGAFNADGAADVKLYVGNLSFDTDETGLRGLFEKYGPVSDCFLPSDRETGRPRGFAFVTMPSDDAKKAMEATDGYELDGRTLRV
eukprot:CAMPEP_0185735830 /NCGR_PEP_ID=MMETSP1171-20130828/26265_1 /TAXON_ID=374046 /ORGANISM="Helicotheca tamensis, Strain CCMP826" /LENGTH=217 /DNA_ID=CAMNT_0028406263 /DNA_START=21 /DNA_END=670 /DNA_ORIENTATION=+